VPFFYNLKLKDVMITLTLVRLISDFTKADGIDLVNTDELYALMSQIHFTIANDLITT
jgi:hypothetical protein